MIALAGGASNARARMGGVEAVQRMLEAFPIRADVRRVTVRRVQFALKDLFMGTKGQEERGKKDAPIKVKFLDVGSALHAEKLSQSKGGTRGMHESKRGARAAHEQYLEV